MMKWNDLDQHLSSFNREVVVVLGDGFYFLDAVRKLFLIDYNEDISIKKMTEMVMYELHKRTHHYSQFHQGYSQQLISDEKGYFKKKVYWLDVLDMCIMAIANELQANLAIFEKVNGKAILINHQCTTANTYKTIIW